MLRLDVVIASTRPGRVGKAVADWFYPVAREHGAFDARLVDLAEMNLPLLDEPNHPRMQKYQHDHTRRWAETVNAADAFVFVVPEYNFGPTPALTNALNYLYLEWNYKTAGFVSYGGASGGLRSVQATKPLLTTLKIMPLVEQVMVPMVNQHLKDGVFESNDHHRDSAQAMLDELERWAGALKPLRAS
ncbi:NADPH-dependent FMN reductase [Alcanivorax xiamenensis]|uniref:NADPH-dependent FMN reductase n=1 Tax=Alcanivorax xiamenensis TaxID=1177156 RepID=A0ABQ6YB74_9GAMM|nr:MULTISPECIES: NAD(P)H-dependent oxidoreductase [Alcanivorax]KAF0807290.1 NADPH-dependent FMN reductase [Alcanivorax xiamenensis]